MWGLENWLKQLKSNKILPPLYFKIINQKLLSLKISLPPRMVWSTLMVLILSLLELRKGSRFRVIMSAYLPTCIQKIKVFCSLMKKSLIYKPSTIPSRLQASWRRHRLGRTSQRLPIVRHQSWWQENCSFSLPDDEYCKYLYSDGLCPPINRVVNPDQGLLRGHVKVRAESHLGSGIDQRPGKAYILMHDMCVILIWTCTWDKKKAFSKKKKHWKVDWLVFT